VVTQKRRNAHRVRDRRRCALFKPTSGEGKRMKRVMAAGLCVASISAAGGGMTASASALPEFTAPYPKAFTFTSKGSLLETVGGKKTKCKSDAGGGEITGPQSGFLRVIFSGCIVNKIPCSTPGLTPGTIATSELGFRVGYINKAKKIVGADLMEPAGLPILEYGCGSSVSATVVGSVIGRFTPVNKLVTPSETFKLRFAQSLGVQKYSALEGGPTDILETSWPGPFEVTGLASRELILFTEPVKLLG
jgi:hypothetical protein